MLKGKGRQYHHRERSNDRKVDGVDYRFDDERGEMPSILNNMLGPKILKSEVQAVVQNMKNSKAVGTDEIAVELIKGIYDFGIEKLKKLLNKIYKSGNIPTDRSRFIFILKKVKVVPYTFVRREVPVRENTYAEPSACEVGRSVPFLAVFISPVFPLGTHLLLGER